MTSKVFSISSNINNIRQDVFPLDPWTFTTRKGIIMQSKCTCQNEKSKNSTDNNSLEMCNLCKYHSHLPHLPSMPDMLFNNNLLKLEHSTGVGIEFNPLGALKLVEETKDPLRVAAADGWQSARPDCPFAKNIVKPFDWTFTTNYKGALVCPTRHSSHQTRIVPPSSDEKSTQIEPREESKHSNKDSTSQRQNYDTSLLSLEVETTDERINVDRLKVREEILFYDDITLYEDELADHGTAQYSVKVRVMPRSFFILARFYLRIDGVLARINDTRIYHDLREKYLLREFTNREARLSALNLPIQTLINPNELMAHLPLIESCYEKLTLPTCR